MASDADNDPLMLSADRLPSGAVFDPSRRVLSWTPDFRSAGTYDDVRFTDSDGLLETTRSVSFLISPVNQAPVLVGLVHRTIREGDTLTLQLVASDSEHDTLHFKSDLLPAGATLDPLSGRFQWTPTFFQHGEFTIPFDVSDGQSVTSTSMAVTVSNVNAAPQYDGLDAFVVQEGQRLNFRAFALDPDNPNFSPLDRLADGTLTLQESTDPTVSYAVTSLPPGASFDAETAMFDWLPGFVDAGNYIVSFTATDDGDGLGAGEVATIQVPITVRCVVIPSRVVSVPVRSVVVPVGRVEPAVNLIPRTRRVVTLRVILTYRARSERRIVRIR